jgi:hypothetical protein
MTLEFSRQIFEKSSNINFPENPSSGSRVVPFGRTDITKLIVVFCNFTNAPQNLDSNAQACNTASDNEGLQTGHIGFDSCRRKEYCFWPPKTWQYWGRPKGSFLRVIPYQIEVHLRRLCHITSSQTDRRTYRPFTSFWPVKNLSELADGPTLYVRWWGEGVFCLVCQSPVSVVERDSLLAFRLKMSWTRTQ